MVLLFMLQKSCNLCGSNSAAIAQNQLTNNGGSNTWNTIGSQGGSQGSIPAGNIQAGVQAGMGNLGNGGMAQNVVTTTRRGEKITLSLPDFKKIIAGIIIMYCHIMYCHMVQKSIKGGK